MPTGASGIEIPANFAVAPVADFAPNPWNPNRMDDFMRKKLARSIKKDGFVIPLLVRPNPAGTTKWEIVDGEQRWTVAGTELNMGAVPYLNLGPISDERAKQITIKANTLKGEFDSVELGKIIKDLVDSEGLQEIQDDLPYTPERIQGLIDLVSGNLNLTAPTGALPGINGEGEGEKKTGDAGSEFKTNWPAEGIDLDDLMRNLELKKFDGRWITLPLRKRASPKLKARAAGSSRRRGRAIKDGSK